MAGDECPEEQREEGSNLLKPEKRLVKILLSSGFESRSLIFSETTAHLQ